jgi:hypothetical protein
MLRRALTVPLVVRTWTSTLHHRANGAMMVGILLSVSSLAPNAVQIGWMTTLIRPRHVSSVLMDTSLCPVQFIALHVPLANI